MKNKYYIAGYSLIELLVVLVVFSVLTIILTQSMASSLRGSRKSENIIEVKQNIDFALSTMERLLRNAQSLTCTSNVRLDYIDEHGAAGVFQCSGGLNGHIASGSAALRLTNSLVYIDCSAGVFQCPLPAAGVPPRVEIVLRGRDVFTPGVESAVVSSPVRVQLRTY
jgi:prepilin-type N-terminal cleavage/methylation domain-containing protein